MRPDAPKAKVIFARETTWLYVIVEGAHAYDVVGEPGNVPLGSTVLIGAASTLFVPAAPGIHAVSLHSARRR